MITEVGPLIFKLLEGTREGVVGVKFREGVTDFLLFLLFLLFLFFLLFLLFLFFLLFLVRLLLLSDSESEDEDVDDEEDETSTLSELGDELLDLSKRVKSVTV